MKMRFKSARLCREASPVVLRAPITLRSWDYLNYDVLVNIMKRVRWHERLYVACLVNKSWLSAVLDSLSPPGMIDLRVMDSFMAPKNNPLRLKRMAQLPFKRYLCFVKRMLDSKPADYCWSSLYFAEVLLKPRESVYIAKRTPSLQQLVIPETLDGTHLCFIRAMPYWKKLKKVQCNVRLFSSCLGSFREVESLRLFGVVDDNAAKAIRDECPQLKQLYLVSCALSINALSTILDGHKKLEVLDTQHCFRVPNCKRSIMKSQAVEWNEEEICHKAAGIKLHLKCNEQHCSKCSAPWKLCFRTGKGIRLKYNWFDIFSSGD